MNEIEIVSINESNIDSVGLGCLKSTSHEGFNPKKKWLLKRIEEGLHLKTILVNGNTSGMIEYVRGDRAWRSVSADGVMFIHCLWITANKLLGNGLGSALVEDCIKHSKELGYEGVAVMTSDKAWMAKKDIFLKHGFSIIDRKERFELLLLGKGKVKFNDWQSTQKLYQGLNLVYADQCPMFTKSINDLRNVALTFGVELNIIRQESYIDAQNAPSGYGTFSLIKDGRLLADHYISGTRFNNILRKEYNI